MRQNSSQVILIFIQLQTATDCSGAQVLGFDPTSYSTAQLQHADDTLVSETYGRIGDMKIKSHRVIPMEQCCWAVSCLSLLDHFVCVACTLLAYISTFQLLSKFKGRILV